MRKSLRNRFSHYSPPGIINNNHSFFRPFESKQETEAIINGKKVLMFGSNSYLGLTTHPKVIEASKEAMEKFGSSCAGSRVLNGTTQLHEQLEYELATFLGKESAIVFSTGFQVNLSTIPIIAQKGDALFLDRLNHASIYEGAQISEAEKLRFRHNDMASLENRLKKGSDANHRIIIVDGIFSMEGDIAKLPEIVRLAEQYDASIMCDCAHAIGVLGDYGRGTSSHFGLTDKVELIGGTFSKSLASLGGFIAGDKETIQFIKYHARSLIFSASMTPASTAAALASLEIIKSDDSHRLKLWENTNYAIGRLNSSGFDIGESETPIIPIYIRDDKKAYAMTNRLFEEGVFVNPVITPAVAPSNSLIRFSLMATHTIEQIDIAIDKIIKVANELGVELKYKAA